MHSGRRAVLHRDIRWPNIIQSRIDFKKWILIDWDEAAIAPAKAALYLARESHAPEVFEDNHGPEVDIWSVGHLIIDISRLLMIPKPLYTIGVWMCKIPRPTANEALTKIMDYVSVGRYIGTFPCIFLLSGV